MTLINEVELILSGYDYIIVDVMVHAVADATFVILLAVRLTQVSHLHEQICSRILKKDDNEIMKIASYAVSSSSLLVVSL